jgi:regulator of RNase E activity RraA
MIETPPLVRIHEKMRRPGQKQIDAFSGIPTGFVVDAMLGGGALSSKIRPIGEGRDIRCVSHGPAMTAHCGAADVLATFAALRFLRPGDIVIAAFDNHQGCAAAGDRLIGMMKNNGAAGFVTDGPVRDYVGITDVGLPVWCTGLTPASPFMSGPGTVGFPVQIGEQQISTGDMIVADIDGVVVVPFHRIDEVINKLDEIKVLERELDVKVAKGLKIPEWVETILDSSQTQSSKH